MRSGIHVRIDANRYSRRAAHLDREPRQQFEFGLGFDIDAENVLTKRLAQLGLGLADAGEQNLVWRNTRSQHTLEFAA